MTYHILVKHEIVTSICSFRAVVLDAAGTMLSKREFAEFRIDVPPRSTFVHISKRASHLVVVPVHVASAKHTRMIRVACRLTSAMSDEFELSRTYPLSRLIEDPVRMTLTDRDHYHDSGVTTERFEQAGTLLKANSVINIDDDEYELIFHCDEILQNHCDPSLLPGRQPSLPPLGPVVARGQLIAPTKDRRVLTATTAPTGHSYPAKKDVGLHRTPAAASGGLADSGSADSAQPIRLVGQTPVTAIGVVGHSGQGAADTSSASDSTGKPSKGSSPAVDSHTCPICLKRFGDVRTHLRTHTREKPFACPHCPFRSAQKGNVKVHMRRHMGLYSRPNQRKSNNHTRASQQQQQQR
ncbi:zinc finger protein-like [Tropilaelaps mercedesae]|uniref:Zinc finger protein-like n=1 Tax=Tropilaelaps mercedesae TaxID=418985 RepID=A0A1V9Y1I8_9ACAR|nr:zinc finger protein-like [Tropilaelaps mercedesae]